MGTRLKSKGAYCDSTKYSDAELCIHCSSWKTVHIDASAFDFCLWKGKACDKEHLRMVCWNLVCLQISSCHVSHLSALIRCFALHIYCDVGELSLLYILV